jgi:Protein of unknown function (DUF3829)
MNMYGKTRSQRLLTATFCATLTFAAPYALPAALAQAPAAKAQQNPELQAAIGKSNAYIGLMNRTLRASDSWRRYASWVNLKTGPTGKERYIDYGLYSLYDVRSEIEKALAATTQPPLVPELDATMKRYVEAYQVLAPVIVQANGYYERKDYKSDGMTEGKALHAKLAPAAETYLRERRLLDAQMRAFKTDVDAKDLAAIEAVDGRKGRWHVKNVMMAAGNLIELLPSNAAPVVEMKAFDESLARYALAVREMDMFSQATPNQFSVFEGQPRSLLGKLRDFRDRLAKTKGDARRGAGNDMTWIINDYNMMVSTSRNATQFAR